MTRLHFHGGFGEKGRTCLGVEGAGVRLLFDIGIMVGAGAQEYHPAIPDAAIPQIDALFVSHAHEDHIGALSWLLARGFRGKVFMTHETWADTPGMQKLYARPEDLVCFDLPEERLHLFRPGETLSFGPVKIRTGRSGHVPGGAWYMAEVEGRRIGYCGDVVPASAVLVMDPMPRCDVVLLDASYGGDDIGTPVRVQEIRDWVGRARDGACLLPLPVSGKPLEILSLLQQPVAIHHTMIRPIKAQLVSADTLHPAAVSRIRAALERAMPWADGDPFPRRPLLTWDGMGASGPSAEAIVRADAEGVPILLTGHIPPATPARRLFDAGRASWIRLPTHPVASENWAIAEGTGAARIFGHSVEETGLLALRAQIPTLNITARTGQSEEI